MSPLFVNDAMRRPRGLISLDGLLHSCIKPLLCTTVLTVVWISVDEKNVGGGLSMHQRETLQIRR